MYTWGLNDLGQLGHSHTDHYTQARATSQMCWDHASHIPAARIVRKGALLSSWRTSAAERKQQTFLQCNGLRYHGKCSCQKP